MIFFQIKDRTFPLFQIFAHTFLLFSLSFFTHLRSFCPAAVTTQSRRGSVQTLTSPHRSVTSPRGHSNGVRGYEGMASPVTVVFVYHIIVSSFPSGIIGYFGPWPIICMTHSFTFVFTTSGSDSIIKKFSFKFQTFIRKYSNINNNIFTTCPKQYLKEIKKI